MLKIKEVYKFNISQQNNIFHFGSFSNFDKDLIYNYIKLSIDYTNVEVNIYTFIDQKQTQCSDVKYILYYNTICLISTIQKDTDLIVEITADCANLNRIE